MKAVVFSDLHLREESREVVLGEVLPAIQDAAFRGDIRDIICLGDVFHLRYRVPVTLLNGLHDWLRRNASLGITTHLLPGNHDQVDVSGRHVLEVFAGPHCVVHTDPGWDAWGFWWPYRRDARALGTHLVDAAGQLEEGRQAAGAPRVMWLHGGVRGAMMNSRLRDTEGVDPHSFAAFEHVHCGHYHKQQALGPGGKVVYVGSPYQTRADEAGDLKGFAIWDATTRTLRRHMRKWGREFRVERVGTLADLERLLASTKATLTDYRLTLAPGCDVTACGELLREAGATQFALTPEAEAKPARLDVRAGSALSTYARAMMEAQLPAEEREAAWAYFEKHIQGGPA